MKKTASMRMGGLNPQTPLWLRHCSVLCTEKNKKVCLSVLTNFVHLFNFFAANSSGRVWEFFCLESDNTVCKIVFCLVIQRCVVCVRHSASLHIQDDVAISNQSTHRVCSFFKILRYINVLNNNNNKSTSL